MELGSRAFFGAAPRDVIGDVVNHVNLCAADALEALERQLCEEQVADARGVKLGIDQFHLKLTRTVDGTMEKFEEYALRNIFLVPEDLALPEADDQFDEQQPAAPVAVLDEDLVRLAERIERAICVRRALVVELRELRAQSVFQQAYAPALAPVAALAPGAAGGDAKLHAALRVLERDVQALDHMRAKILERLSHLALRLADGETAIDAAPAIKTGGLEDLARLSRNLRALR
ncbi:hypothetical protein T492DRAFT_1079714 [Pavlovales sp. CCMP2436]|nr:hypothetical protein T492DRAFT_1079714 [Pavlovales sp. CCMP2436]